jgi:hypothetical protein
VPSARLGIQWLPVSDDPAGLAPNVLQGPIAPNVAFRVLRMALDENRAKFVVGPYPSRAPAERAVATRRLIWCKWKREADCSAMTGPVQRYWWLSLIHRNVPLIVIPPNAGI